MNSYDIVADTVRKYQNEVSHYPCDVIAFFYQRYDYDHESTDIVVVSMAKY